MGNEAIARGALEAGAKVCSAYPGNPSSEIIGSLSKVADRLDLHIEWSVNEKVALEIVAAASFAGLRGLTAMKQNGINVAADFLLNLNLTGCKGGLVVVVTDDPGALSSSNEEDSRSFAKLGDLPLLEPSTFQEAKDMTRWAFELSEDLELPVLVRSVTRVSHARGNVRLNSLPIARHKPTFDTSNPRISLPVLPNHQALRDKRNRVAHIFEKSSFNFYRGPETVELLVITTGTGWMYTIEAIANLAIKKRVGILRLGTTWPLPEILLLKHLRQTDRILFVEEVDPFVENNVMTLFARHCLELGAKQFLGKTTGTLSDIGELNPDIVTKVISDFLGVAYKPRPVEYTNLARKASSELVPDRNIGFCAGCPHRATYWAIKNALALDGRNGFVLGDIGCYSLGIGPSGFKQMKTLHSMGSGTGLACGFGQLNRFGFEQPVLAVCGDSTFYHAVMPALTNAKYNGANFLLLLLDNSATPMTGFQPHPGTGRSATGHKTPILDLASICNTLGARVEVIDPFSLAETTETILRLLQDTEGAKVIIVRRECALVRSKKREKYYQMKIDTDLCLGESCGCNRLCTRIFKCPGLIWDSDQRKACIDEAICTGCGVCAEICPASAIQKEET
jgi:indolepyruvate ferredoxin oxidoreductase alpha subunit